MVIDSGLFVELIDRGYVREHACLPLAERGLLNWLADSARFHRVICETSHILGLQSAEIESPVVLILFFGRGRTGSTRALFSLDVKFCFFLWSVNRVNVLHDVNFYGLIWGGEIVVLGCHPLIVLAVVQYWYTLFLRIKCISDSGTKPTSRLHGHVSQKICLSHKWVHWFVGSSWTQLRRVLGLWVCVPWCLGNARVHVSITTPHRHQILSVKRVLESVLRKATKA